MKIRMSIWSGFVAVYLGVFPTVVSAGSYKLVTLEYPPYEYTENGQIKGLAVEIIKEVFKQMRHELTISVYPWARSIELFKEGEVDGIFTFFKTPEREEFTLFSKEIIIAQPITLWVLKDSKIEFNGDLSRLFNYKFGVVAQTSYGEIFDNAVKNRTIKTDEANSIESCISKLIENRFDIWISNHYGGVYSLRKAGKFKEIKELNPPIQETLSYVGFSKKRNLEVLRDDFDKTFAQVKKSGKYDKIIKEYMDSLK